MLEAAAVWYESKVAMDMMEEELRGSSVIAEAETPFAKGDSDVGATDVKSVSFETSQESREGRTVRIDDKEGGGT
jgi:hypothetical protein